MSDAPAISVIIPAHQAEAFLADAIASVLGQTLVADEILVIDDGSTDATATIARSFGDPVRLLQQARGGPAAARNLGIRSARHAWLAFLDADDLMPPRRLAIQYSLTRSGTVRESPLLGQQRPFSARHPMAAGNGNGPFAIRPGLIPSALFCHAGMFARHGLFDTEFTGPEFIQWLTRVMETGVTPVVAPDVVVYRRLHADSLSRVMTRESDEYPKLIKWILDRRRRERSDLAPGPAPDR